MSLYFVILKKRYIFNYYAVVLSWERELKINWSFSSNKSLKPLRASLFLPYSSQFNSILDYPPKAIHLCWLLNILSPFTLTTSLAALPQQDHLCRPLLCFHITIPPLLWPLTFTSSNDSDLLPTVKSSFPVYCYLT